MNREAQAFLNKYLSTLTPDELQKYASFSADYFCADEYNANLCAELVKRGEKRATCSLDYWYSHKSETRPTVGHLQVVTNWFGKPICIVEITKVLMQQYCNIDEDFAIEEGEGDKTLTWWRDAHWQFFSAECKELGITPTENMLLVLEHFQVVYK
ncbi:ASCH domain-containing protein [Marinomonas agarivorans]|nr:ASCH domain-containing protein [Marinomonas agarivorans]